MDSLSQDQEHELTTETRIDHDDVLSFLAGIENDSIDYINTDPPYFIGYDDGKGWDSAWANENEYLEWCREWTNELVRVLRPGRMMTVWGTLKTDTFLKYKINVLNEFSELFGQNEIVWSYNWGGRSPSNFARKHEYAWSYSKGQEFLFNADDVRVDRKMKTNPRTGKAFTKGTIPTSVWEQNNHTASKDFVNWHPTTKNLTVLERMIRAYSNESDTVLDCFSGSGSTAVAALRCHRNFIGSEIDREYYEKSLDRVARG